MRDSDKTFDILTKNIKATGRHFNLPGPSESDLKITKVKKIHNRVVWVREEMKSMHIGKANTFNTGINLKPLIREADKNIPRGAGVIACQPIFIVQYVI